MKALCITGADNATLANIAAPFYNAGMQRPKALQRESEINFTRWHQQVNGTLTNGQPMGKLWENMATDLILANLESECWGWYEAGSVEALEFWADLEPNIHFLLVCTRPEQELADRMAHTEADAKAHQWLDQWHDRHQRMLDFYLKHPNRCLLVDAEDAKAHLNGQLALAHEHWQLPLDAAHLEASAQSTAEPDTRTEQAEASPQPGNPIASLLVRELIKHAKKDITGLYAELQAAQYPFNVNDQGEPASQQLMNWLRADVDAPMLQSLLADYHQLHNAAHQSKELLALQHDQSQEAELHLSQLKQKLEDAQQENELLLLQLHQVQEELESTFLAKQQLQKDLDDAKAKPQAQAANPAELQAANTALQNAQQQKAALEQRLANAEAELKALQAQTQAQANTQQQLQDAQQENELLLLQLHQVQEELEHYFLEHQKRQQETTDLQEKLNRLKRQGTAQFSAARVTTGEHNGLHWHLTDADLAGQEWPELTIAGQTGFSKTELTINAGEDEAWTLSTQTPSQTLSNAQWALALELPKTLKSALEHAPINPRQKQRWHKALDKLQHHLNAQPARLLYSGVHLKREQVNPDYEHLWLTLEQPSFNETHLQRWSFRLSCAGVTPNDFGQQPKLELPEQDAQLLDSWFHESQDGFGNKLELRFALPNAMDTGVWKRLSTHDKALLSALIQQLPNLLNQLKEQGTYIERDWDDWHTLASNLQRIHTSKTQKK